MATKVATQNGLAGQITQRIEAVRLTCYRHGHLMQRSQLPALRKELEMCMRRLDEAVALTQELGEQHEALTAEIGRVAQEIQSDGS